MSSESNDINNLVDTQFNGSAKAGDEEDELLIDLQARVTGRVDTLRNTILSMVATHRWKSATRELVLYREVKSELAVFERLTGIYFEKAIACINAIADLESIPDLEKQPYSFRSQVNHKVVLNFEKLTEYLSKIETFENDIKVKDIHSTVWVAKALIVALTSVVCILAFDEGLRTMGLPVSVIANDASNFLFSILGL